MPEEMLVQIARRLREHRHWHGDRPVRLLVGGVVITIRSRRRRPPVVTDLTGVDAIDDMVSARR